MFRLPILSDTSGQAIDRALLALHGDTTAVEAARIELAIDSGTLSTTLAAVDTGMATAFKATASSTLRPHGQAGVNAVHEAISKTLEQVTVAARTGQWAR